MGDKKAHSPIGASSMHRWAKCPGSVRLCAGVPSKSSAYADEGTLAHALAEYCLRRGKTARGVTRFEGKDLPPDMPEAVQVYLDAVRADVAEGYELHVEVGFDLSHLHPGLYGTSDAVLWHSKLQRLKVYDYKHGAGVPVEVADNEQLTYYAVGALLTTKVPATQVELCVVQPRCNHQDGPVRRTTLEPLELLDFCADLKRLAQATEVHDAPLVPGDHCRWCPAAAICPALRERAQAAAKSEFSVPVVADATNVCLPYDPTKLAEALTLADLLEDWAKNVREFAYHEAMRGRPPPNFKLVAKRATRKWTESTDVAGFLNLLGLSDEVIYEPRTLRSPPQIEAQVGKKDFAQHLSKLVVKESSGYTLVPVSDARPAVSLGAVHEFTAVTAGSPTSAQEGNT